MTTGPKFHLVALVALVVVRAHYQQITQDDAFIAHRHA